MRNPNLVKQVPEHLKKCLKILSSEIDVRPVSSWKGEIKSMIDEIEKFIEEEEKLNAFD